jgi:non-specific serine/threonine protein kinase
MDKSLVMALELELDQMRYRLLEPTWQYAKEKLLESGEFERLQSYHLEFFLNLAEEAEPHFSQADQGAWYDRLTAESDNLRAAIYWSLRRGAATAALRLTRALHDFWSARGHYQEGVGLLMQALSQSDAAIPSGARANALQAAGVLLLWSDSNWSQARPLLEQALATGRKLADKKIIASSLSVLGAGAYSQKEFAAAQSFLDESLVLRRELGDNHGLGWSLAYLGDVALVQRDDVQAGKRYEESAECFREIGDSNSLAYPIRRLGGIALDRGDYQQAITLFRESLTRNGKVTNPKGIAACLVAFAALAVKHGQFIRAAKLFGAGEVILGATAGELFTTDQIEFDVNVAALRARLEETSIDAAWAEGRAMTLEQAIDYALTADEDTR